MTFEEILTIVVLVLFLYVIVHFIPIIKIYKEIPNDANIDKPHPPSQEFGFPANDYYLTEEEKYERVIDLYYYILNGAFKQSEKRKHVAVVPVQCFSFRQDTNEERKDIGENIHDSIISCNTPEHIDLSRTGMTENGNEKKIRCKDVTTPSKSTTHFDKISEYSKMHEMSKKTRINNIRSRYFVYYCCNDKDVNSTISEHNARTKWQENFNAKGTTTDPRFNQGPEYKHSISNVTNELIPNATSEYSFKLTKCPSNMPSNVSEIDQFNIPNNLEIREAKLLESLEATYIKEYNQSQKNECLTDHIQQKSPNNILKSKSNLLHHSEGCHTKQISNNNYSPQDTMSLKKKIPAKIGSVSNFHKEIIPNATGAKTPDLPTTNDDGWESSSEADFLKDFKITRAARKKLKRMSKNLHVMKSENSKSNIPFRSPSPVRELSSFDFPSFKNSQNVYYQPAKVTNTLKRTSQSLSHVKGSVAVMERGREKMVHRAQFPNSNNRHDHFHSSKRNVRASISPVRELSQFEPVMGTSGKAQQWRERYSFFSGDRREQYSDEYHKPILTNDQVCRIPNHKFLHPVNKAKETEQQESKHRNSFLDSDIGNEEYLSKSNDNVFKNNLSEEKKYIPQEDSRIDSEKDCNSLAENSDIAVPAPALHHPSKISKDSKLYRSSEVVSADETFLIEENGLRIGRERCFLYGLSLSSIPLKDMLYSGQTIEYELMERDAQSVRECWIGKPIEAERERYQAIEHHCNRINVSTLVKCRILEKIDYIPEIYAPVFERENLRPVICL